MAVDEYAQKRAQLELGVLYRISQRLTQQHDVSSLLNDVMDILETEFGLSRGTLTLRQPDSDVFVIEASRGLTAEERRRGQYKLGEGVTGRVARDAEPAMVPDISVDPNFLNRTGSREQKRVAFLCVPIVHQRQVIGTMSIDRPTAPPAELSHDLHFLQLAADLLAEGVARIREEREERDSLMAENRRLREQLGNQYHPSNMVGNCSSMRQVYEQIAQVADSPATVLIRGESGTGKELVARAIHAASPRANKPFVAVNCAALTESLLESELFGHEKGAFTGATAQAKGRFELADTGTLFLDEVGELSPNVQTKFLRVLEESCFQRVGGARQIHVDVRVIAATNRDLPTMVSDGSFRADLFYRLQVIQIELPPVRRRTGDVPLLVQHFVQRYASKMGRRIEGVAPDAMDAMCAYPWPGNVRELKNAIERAMVLGEGPVLRLEDLPPSISAGGGDVTEALGDVGVRTIKEMEREAIVAALRETQGNKARAAQLLEIDRSTLYKKIKDYEIDV